MKIWNTPRAEMIKANMADVLTASTFDVGNSSDNKEKNSTIKIKVNI